MELVWFCCWSSRTKPVPSWSCLPAISKPVWHIPLLCVGWKTADDGQRNCPKHVDFYSKKIWEISASSWFYYKNIEAHFVGYLYVMDLINAQKVEHINTAEYLQICHICTQKKNDRTTVLKIKFILNMPWSHMEGVKIQMYTFLNLSTRREWMINAAPHQLCSPGKHPVSVVQEVGWASKPDGKHTEYLAPTRVHTRGRPAHSDSLHRLQYPRCLLNHRSLYNTNNGTMYRHRA